MELRNFRRGRHLYSAGRPSRWASANILVLTLFIMPALWNRAGHYILPCCFYRSFFFFPRLLSAVADGCLPYFHTWCALSANLECMSEMCCMRLAENTGRKNYAKNRHPRTIARLCRAVSSQLRHVSTMGKTLVKRQYLFHLSSQYAELWSIYGWDLFTSLGHPSKFQRVSRLGFVTAPTSLNGRQPNFAQCLALSCAGILYIHFRRLLHPNGILPGAKFTLCPNLAFSYIDSVTARHSSTERQPNFVAFSRGRHLYSAGRPSR